MHNEQLEHGDITHTVLPPWATDPATDDHWHHYRGVTLATGPCRKRSLCLPWLSAGQLPETVRAERAVAFRALMPGETAKHPPSPSAPYTHDHGGTSTLPTGAATPEGRPGGSSENRRAPSRGRRLAEAARIASSGLQPVVCRLHQSTTTSPGTALSSRRPRSLGRAPRRQAESCLGSSTAETVEDVPVKSLDDALEDADIGQRLESNELMFHMHFGAVKRESAHARRHLIEANTDSLKSSRSPYSSALTGRDVRTT